MQRVARTSRRWFAELVAALAVVGSLMASDVSADPATDALAKLNELSRAAEQATEAMHSAQLDLDAEAGRTGSR